MNNRQVAGIVAIAGFLVAGQAAADDLSITNLMGKVPTENEIIDGLITPTGLRIEPATPTTPAAAPGTAGSAANSAVTVERVAPAATAPQAAIALEIQFEFDSAGLSGDARQVLDQLGGALKSEALQSFSFLVEGHTDSVGSEAYNLDLSDRRAQAVSAYLSRQFGVEAGRLTTVGRGEAQPFDPSDPASGINRRVQIVNLGG